MKFLSLLKTSNARSSWAWPSCHQPRTLSFRAAANNLDDVVFKSPLAVETSESFFTESPTSLSFSTASEESRGADPIEAVIRGLRSERLFFEADETSSLFEAKLTSHVPFKNSVVLSLDSRDPYVDFRRSMEEMVETLGVGDWESLEELLCWYLKVNRKSNHGYIVGAFVDLLFGLAFSSSSSEHSRPPSPLSFYSSSSPSSSCSTPCVWCFEQNENQEEEEEVEEEDSPLRSSFLLVKGEITPEGEDEGEDEGEASSSS
ncbi:Transcription repressor OFP13, partial [Mucuna pruriens]